MINRGVTIVCGFIGIGMFAWFIISLSYSISTGFAGFRGGFPFAIIVLFVLLLVVYDYWEQCIKKPVDEPEG